MTGALLVVKLGGSHTGSTMLRPWLRAIEAAAGHVALVPGGGPFADAVRAAQEAIGFDNAAADEMALLAMAQFGRALVSIGSRSELVDTIEAIDAARTGGRVPVFSPVALRAQSTTLAQSWDVTSDSIAAWLAERLGARLLLVKRIPAPVGATLRDLARQGIVDRAFPDAAARVPVWIAGPEDCPAALDAGAPPGRCVPAIPFVA